MALRTALAYFLSKEIKELEEEEEKHEGKHNASTSLDSTKQQLLKAGNGNGGVGGPGGGIYRSSSGVSSSRANSVKGGAN